MICTDIEQSQKLVELGIDISTADMDYIPFANDPENYDCVINLWNNEHEDGWIPAWSLSALLGLMPFHIIENNNRFGFYQVKGFNKQGETYRFGYKTNYNSFLFETSWNNNVINAAFEMICWLKKKKYIQNKKHNEYFKEYDSACKNKRIREIIIKALTGEIRYLSDGDTNECVKWLKSFDENKKESSNE